VTFLGLFQTVWLGALRAPRPQFIVSTNVECLKYL